MMHIWVVQLALLLLSPAHFTDLKSAAPEWQPVGLSGGGAIFEPAISPSNPNLMMLNCDMSGVYVSRDGGSQWKMINHLQLRSNIRCRPAFHPSDQKTIFAANGYAGLAVSHDGGDHWKSIGNLSGALTGDICIDRNSPNNMMVAAGKTVYRSNDSGSTWAPCEGSFGEYLGGHFDQTSKADNRTCFIASSVGIWRSDDAGVTFSPKSNGLPDPTIKSFAAGSNQLTGRIVLYCSTPTTVKDGKLVGGIYRSTDRGETWVPAMGQGLNLDTQAFDEWSMGPTAQYLHLVSSDVYPERVFATNSNTGIPAPHHATVFRSTDSGQTWNSIFQPDPRFPSCNVESDYTFATDGQFYQSVPEIAVSPTDPDKILMANGSCSYATTNGGGEWKSSHTHPFPHSNDKEVLWSNSGLVVTTTWNYYIDPNEPTRHYICYTDIGFARSFDSGIHWEWWSNKGRAPWQNTCYQLSFDPVVKGRIWGAFSNVHDIPNGNIIWGSHRATGPGGICFSDDFGATWKPRNGDLPLNPTTAIEIDTHSSVTQRTLYAGQFGGGVFRSENGGTTWVPTNNGLGSDSNRRVSRLVLHTDGTLFAVVTAKTENGQFKPQGVGIYRSRDRGDHWTKINESQPFLWPKDLTVDPTDSRVIYVGAADAKQDQAGLWRTKDGGEHWTRILKVGPEHFGAYLHPQHQGWIYATLTEGAPLAGLWLSKDDGETWKPVDALPFSNVQRVTFDKQNPNVIYVTTFGGSVWKGPAD